MPGLNRLIVQPESNRAAIDKGFVVDRSVGDFELLLCHQTVCVVGGGGGDLILQINES